MNLDQFPSRPKNNLPIYINLPILKILKTNNMTIFQHLCVFPNWYLQGNVRQLIFETFCEKYPSTSGGCLNPWRLGHKIQPNKTCGFTSQETNGVLEHPGFDVIHVDTSGVFDVESWNVSVVNVLLFNYCKVPKPSSENSSPNFNPRSVCWWVLWAWKCPPKYSGGF